MNEIFYENQILYKHPRMYVLCDPWPLLYLNLAASLPVGSMDSFSAASRTAMRAAFFYAQKTHPDICNGNIEEG